jgi:cytidine deaminase
MVVVAGYGSLAPATTTILRGGRCPVAANGTFVMTVSDRDELIQAALAAQQRAYSPYSNFPVGAAIRSASGRVHQGVNVENASYGLTLCAERVAAAAAVAAGDCEFTAIAVASRGGASPCGACRQFLAEFNPKVQVLMVDSEAPNKISETTLDVLLPVPFSGPT